MSEVTRVERYLNNPFICGWERASERAGFGNRNCRGQHSVTRLGQNKMKEKIQSFLNFYKQYKNNL